MSFYVMPNPSWLRGAVAWTDNYCCDVWGDGTNFTYACDRSWSSRQSTCWDARASTASASMPAATNASPAA